MWLRDSANQLQSYKSILGDERIAKLYRGTINLQSRYLQRSPHCNAFQPPLESGIKPAPPAIKGDIVTPAYDPKFVFECKYELDSLAAFFQLSYDYWHATGDVKFFGRFNWKDTVRTVLDVVGALMEGTYAQDGSVNESPYTWLRRDTSSTETVANRGTGEPIKGNIGLVRSFFRPSDDSCIFQYFIPGNMMLARYVKATAEIMDTIDQKLSAEMRELADDVEKAIREHAVVNHPVFGDVYAYEINGFGSYNLMVSLQLTPLFPVTPMCIRRRNYAESKSLTSHFET